MKYDPVTYDDATKNVHVCAVVVTYNRLSYLKMAVSALIADDVDRIIVVDNGSTDDTSTWLASTNLAKLQVVTLPENRGGSGGFEAGVETAISDPSVQWLVLMDDDSKPIDGAIARFRETAQTNTVHAAAVYYPDGEICEMNRPSVNPFWNIKAFVKTLFGGGRRGFHLADEAFEQSEPQNIDVASFVGYFLPVAAVRKVGLPDGSLFIYGDDVMYSLKLRKAGVPIVFDPRVKFEHDCRTKDRETGSVAGAKWKIYYLYRNGIFMYRETAGWLYPLVLPIFLVKWFLTVGAHRSDRKIERQLYWMAIRDGLMGRRDRPHSDVRMVAEKTA